MQRICPHCQKPCKDYSNGYNQGWSSLHEDFAPRYYHGNVHFMSGWKDGKRQIDREADEAFQSYYSLD